MTSAHGKKPVLHSSFEKLPPSKSLVLYPEVIFPQPQDGHSRPAGKVVIPMIERLNLLQVSEVIFSTFVPTNHILNLYQPAENALHCSHIFV